MNAIEVHGLVKRFGNKTVVDNVSMTVKTGEIAGFLGPKHDPWQVSRDPNSPDFRMDDLRLATAILAERSRVC